MSLPTPPNTGHREKENRVPGGAHVIWSPHNQYRTITPIPQVPAATSASKTRPTKSILKKRSEPLLPLVAFQRETTPEPPQPKYDPNYLSSPVATIVSSSASLDDLIRAYSVLAARIKANIALADSDASAKWLILQPLQKHRIELEEAIVRDLARCLVDPETMDQTPEDMEEEACLKEQPALLPSPKSSPKKKRGTTARKAKYGRDLCTTCHSVIKLLAVVFTLPAVSGVFTIAQLKLILAQVLAIPLADDLPTPNARKTYALAIWLLQSQRLSPAVLEKAADRIVFALRRGIEGELGKEGKKGSASDGLKAIHDLSVYQPSIFVPRFETVLQAVLGNLLAPTLGIRAQACHALGGLARGLVTLPVSSLHNRVSAAVISFLTAAPPSPSPSKKSPTKSASNDSALMRTLRTTVRATEVQHVSQGPVWGLSVLASLLILANSAVYAHEQGRRAFIALLSCAMQHQKSSIRSLGCAVWRCAAWAYCQPLLPNGDDESEVDEESDARTKSGAIQQGREHFWTQVVVTVVDMGVGLSTIAALLEETTFTSEESLARVAAVLKSMASKGGTSLVSAFDVLARMVSFEPAKEWSWSKLLPRGLFSASPGLLTADYAALKNPVESVLAQCPNQKDIRSLTREEVAQPEIFDKLVEMWRECLGCLGLHDNEAIPSNLLLVWDHLILANAILLQDSDTPADDTVEFANKAADILVDILLDTTMDVTLKVRGTRFCTDGLEPTNELSNAALKVRLVRALWETTRTIIPRAHLGSAAYKLVFTLLKQGDEFTDSGKASWTEWAAFCAEALMVCDHNDLQEFWNCVGASNTKWDWTDATMSTVWRTFVEKWKDEAECPWPAVLLLLTIPFTAKRPWELCDSDFELWDALILHAVDKGLDYGVDAVAVFDHVAAILMEGQSPTSTTSSRVADVLLTRLEIEEVRELPEALFEFINDTLRSSYPPEPRNAQQALWTLRSVARTIENCPAELVEELLRLIEVGLCLWVSDEHKALSETDYTYDAVNLYEVILMRLRSLPHHLSILESVASILESGFVGRKNKPAAIAAAFAEFWNESYSRYPVPEDGWPAEIQTCLGISSDEVDELDPEDRRDKLSLSPPFRGAQVVSAIGKEVPVGSPFKLHSARFRSVSPEAAGETGGAREVAQPPRPTTPVTSRSCPSTPPRPHKLPFVSQSSPASPASPLYVSYPPTTPKRTPLRATGSSKSSPNKRRKLDDKENVSPGLLISPVVERIAAASPRSGYDLVLSKKHASPDHGEEERPAKRSKLDRVLSGGGQQSFHPAPSSSSTDEAEEEEERLVQFNLVEQSSPSSSEEPTPLSKKRKRVLFDAVEVPSVRQVYPERNIAVSPTFATPSKHERVQARSTSQAARRASWPKVSPSSLRKRRRDSEEDSEDPFSDDRERTDSSSDDDAYFGQVTPYHVVSPALRRTRDDDPPSSDDSNMTSSPLKGVVSRRLRLAALSIV
ncbi:hypothetical protein B0H15DRAFT_1019816 [Mycena belliarum]|uniref:Telomere-associated protein Rif1 N-terminal domain-containing protein n=1 Tax=Mycena belliarum TaxID=1033014 RepID=A0AAD6UG91_9AGAR|nr:hypothetical protein B0H15DRAFT_1019816 [Mycena belliae]